MSVKDILKDKVNEDLTAADHFYVNSTESVVSHTCARDVYWEIAEESGRGGLSQECVLRGQRLLWVRAALGVWKFPFRLASSLNLSYDLENVFSALGPQLSKL